MKKSLILYLLGIFQIHSITKLLFNQFKFTQLFYCHGHIFKLFIQAFTWTLTPPPTVHDLWAPGSICPMRCPGVGPLCTSWQPPLRQPCALFCSPLGWSMLNKNTILLRVWILAQQPCVKHYEATQEHHMIRNWGMSAKRKKEKKRNPTQWACNWGEINLIYISVWHWFIKKKAQRTHTLSLGKSWTWTSERLSELFQVYFLVKYV